jgi:hypothetical protein
LLQASKGELQQAYKGKLLQASEGELQQAQNNCIIDAP